MAAVLQDRLGGDPHAKQSLRLWLRLLTCASVVERRLAGRFREAFDSTLPRFDFLAALDRAGEAGLALGEVSRLLMVTNGNVTGLANRLRADGLIEPCESADRRSQRVRLSALGRARFAEMAAAHEGWIDRMFAGLDDAEAAQLMDLLERTKRSLQADGETRP
jgi:DNA-binding MarR family transcriptional regulator